MLSSVPFDPAEVLTTHTLDAYIDMGRPMLNNYIRYAKVGGGQHGEVYLCYKSDPKLPTNHPEYRIPVVRLYPDLHLPLHLITRKGYEIRQTRQPPR